MLNSKNVQKERITTANNKRATPWYLWRNFADICHYYIETLKKLTKCGLWKNNVFEDIA